jgi:hypothetical protein
MKIKSSAYKENLIYLTLWLILFIAPASSMYMRVQNNSAMSMDWSEIFHVWNLYTAYLIIFLIHNFILAPLLIYKKKKVIYLATTICLITIFVIFQFSQKPKDFRKKMEKHRIEFMARDLRMHGFKVDKLPHQFDRADRKMSHNADEMMENLLGGGGRSYKFVLNDKLRQVLEPLAADRRGGQGYKGRVHVDTYKENRNIATVELSPDRLIAFMCSVPNENRDRVSITLIDAKRMDRRHTVYRVARNEGQRKEAAPSIADLIGKRH